MIYVVSVVIAVLVILNLYASVKVLRSDFGTRTQKLLQLGFVWFLPIIGPVIAVSLVSGTGHSTVDFADSKTMGFESYWNASLGGEDSAANHSSSDSSCD